MVKVLKAEVVCSFSVVPSNSSRNGYIPTRRNRALRAPTEIWGEVVSTTKALIRRVCIAWEEREQWKGTSVWVWHGSEPALSLCLSDTSQGHSAYSEFEVVEAFQSITYGHESTSAIQTD